MVNHTRKKTIFYIEFLKITAANTLSMIIQGLNAQNNCNIVLLCQKSSYLAKSLKGTNIRIYEIDYEEFRIRSLASYVSYFRQMLLIMYIIIRHKVDIIHCHRLNWAYLCIIPSLIFHVPLYVQIVIIEKLESRFQNFLLRIHKHIRYIAVSKNSLKQFRNLYKESFHFGTYHYGGIFFPEMEKWRHVRMKNLEEARYKKTRIVALVSRMDPLKGVDVFIEAAALLAKKYTDVQFVHFGNHNDYVFQDQYYEACKKRVVNLGLASRFRFFDYTEDILAAYKYFYICVLPTYKDTLSFVNLEANYFNKPVVFTDVDGLMETSRAEFNCSIPYPPSPLLLAQKIESLLKDTRRYRLLQDQVSHYVQRKFSAERNAERLLRLYELKDFPTGKSSANFV
ncbi:glycosyltransferase family 4 protein [Patescibacteria group bacterium]|nr:glycosyltransferase family 4 protein [Patescibacteria group bacterium]